MPALVGVLLGRAALEPGAGLSEAVIGMSVVGVTLIQLGVSGFRRV